MKSAFQQRVMCVDTNLIALIHAITLQNETPVLCRRNAHLDFIRARQLFAPNPYRVTFTHTDTNG